MEPKKLIVRVIFPLLLILIFWIGARWLFYEMALYPSARYDVSLNGIEEKEITIDTGNGEECLVVSFDYNTEMNIEIVLKEVDGDDILYQNRYQSPFKTTHREMLGVGRRVKKVSFKCISHAPNSKVKVSISKYGSCF